VREQRFVVERASPWEAYAAFDMRFQGPRLTILTGSDRWSLGGTATATHHHSLTGILEPHDHVPSEGCMCGLSVEKTLEKVIGIFRGKGAFIPGKPLALGRVDWQARGMMAGKLSVWGTLFVSGESYRCEHGLIDAFLRTPLQMALIPDLRARWDIPFSRWDVGEMAGGRAPERSTSSG